MAWLKNLKIAHKLVIFFLFVFLLFAGLGLFNYQVSGNISKSMQEMYELRMLSLSLMNEWAIKHKDTESLVLQALMTPNNKAKIVNLTAIIEGNHHDIVEVLEKYEKIHLDEVERIWLAQLMEEQQQYNNSLRTTNDLIFQNKQKEAYDYYMENSFAHANNISILLRVMSDHNKKMAEEQYLKANRLAKISLIVIYLIPFIGALYILLLAYFINQSLTGPLKTLLNQIIKVAEGDFDNLKKRIQVDSTDEIGLLAQSFNNMSQTIEKNMRELSEKNEIIKAQANQDPLTGLPNRRMLENTLNNLLHETKIKQSKLAIFYIDLDNFKTINDTMGHLWGDRVLKQVARRLEKGCVRCDLIARLGGDEFVVVASNLKNRQEAENIAQSIKTLAQPLFSGKKQIYVTMSIGISMFPDHGENGTTLLNAADTALYEAKRSGRDTFQFYTDEMRGKVLNRSQMEEGRVTKSENPENI